MRALEVEGLRKSFGGFAALRGVDLHVDEGELFGLIGPNGSGKTTFFNCVTGSLKCSAGKVAFKEREITNSAPDAIYRMGIGRTYQLIELFPGMTVLENMLLALQERQGSMFGRLSGYEKKPMNDRPLSCSSSCGSCISKMSWPGTFPTGSRSSWTSAWS
jgi:branched-chain amino acid transport system ATP-binding protein